MAVQSVCRCIVAAEPLMPVRDSEASNMLKNRKGICAVVPK